MRILQEAGTYEIMENTPEEALTTIEFAGRICHKSLDKMNEDSAEKFVKKVMKLGHESVLEHRPLLFLLEIGDLTKFLWEYMEFKEATEASTLDMSEGTAIFSMNTHTLRDGVRDVGNSLVGHMYHADD